MRRYGLRIRYRRMYDDPGRRRAGGRNIANYQQLQTKAWPHNIVTLTVDFHVCVLFSSNPFRPPSQRYRLTPYKRRTETLNKEEETPSMCMSVCHSLTRVWLQQSSDMKAPLDGYLQTALPNAFIPILGSEIEQQGRQSLRMSMAPSHSALFCSYR